MEIQEVINKISVQEELLCFYDDYQGLKLIKRSGNDLAELFRKLKDTLHDNFYFRVFCRKFDFVFFYGDIYFSESTEGEKVKVYINNEVLSELNKPVQFVWAYCDKNMPSNLRFIELG